MGTTTTLLTFEEFERLPDQPGKRELLEGELIELPPAELIHNRIAHRIWRLLMPALIYLSWDRHFSDPKIMTIP